MERWKNKVAVVTGASSGIGAATCKALLARDLIVVGLARRLERMERDLKANLPDHIQSRFYAYRCDVSKEPEICQAFQWIEEHLGGVDILVNNAAKANFSQLIEENNTDILRSIIDTNVFGVAFCTREAFQSMKKRDVEGHVIVINSIVGHTVPIYPGHSFNMYAPSKHALTAMTEVLRQEFQTNNSKVKITSISPGAVDTELIPPEAAFRTKHPMLKPEDIVEAMIFCIQTPPTVQVHEMIIRPMGATF